MISLISSLSLKLYLNSLVYHRNIFGSSSKVFGNLRKSSSIFGNSRKMFGSVRPAFGTILKFLRKSSEGGRKSSGNHQKRRHQHVYVIKRTLHGGLKIWIFIFSWQKTIFYSLAALVLKILFCHSKIKFISSRPRAISSIYFLQLAPLRGETFSNHAHKTGSWYFLKCIWPEKYVILKIRSFKRLSK